MPERKRIVPPLDPDFRPVAEVYRDFERRVRASLRKPLVLGMFRDTGCEVFRTEIFDADELEKTDPEFAQTCRRENAEICGRLVKTLLWSSGGYRVYVAEDGYVLGHIRNSYREGGARQFDARLMQRVYGHPFEVVSCSIEEVPETRTVGAICGGTFEGCRIGFDAGGSDRKAVACIDGKVVYSEEVEWQPKTSADPDYVRRGVESAFASAASYLPRVDGIGVSTAGICVDNKLMESSLLRRLTQAQRDSLKDIYIEAAKKYSAPLSVANDGDVTALAGGIRLGKRGVLGIAMGTSEASGYLDRDGNLGVRLSELSSVPIDARQDAEPDSFTGDVGCGGRYLSQDGVVRLAERAGIPLAEDTQAGKLKQVQSHMKRGEPVAFEVYASVGVYLGYALAWYSLFYPVDEVLVLGRVMSGAGGEAIMGAARAVLAQYPECAFPLNVPDERDRRLGQAIAAASLPDVDLI